MQIDKVYDPQRFEPHWAEWWINHGVFRADAKAPGRMFSLVIPPPNVTGSLHVGHMLEHTIIDAAVRWHRMLGDNTLWLPGNDHAGIATQMLVERDLAKSGLTRQQIGREEFVKRVWLWKEQYGNQINQQMKRAGASCDWTRERFTLDPGLSRAVRETFVRLYEKGLIYRGSYMVNWCPRCHTALSDLEVVHDETPGSLWHIRYPVIGTSDHVVVATTRPETMLGDTAVAINPADTRYTRFHGKMVRLPLMDREIPVILDSLADPEFGTGVVKVTPAHDPNDFEAGKRNNLPSVKVIDETAHMTAEAGRWAGMDRFEARKSVVAALDKLGLLEKVEPYVVSVSKCQRCKTPVEPLVSTQWWVKIKPLAEPAIKVVENGEIVFVPANWTKTYYEWMYNIRDWCISRQLWWGHRIPAWHCGDCGGITVSRQDPAACSKCGSRKIEQDPDVLDTWFSSGLWPFSTMGWPDDTEDLRTYYPTTLMVTGFDILFFWVARMIMLGLEMTGKIPFRQVHIHGLVRDAERQKMSKTRGNTVDPLEINAKYGTDAVRFALLISAAPGADIALSDDRLLSVRGFANKIWNASRLIFMNMERSAVEFAWPQGAPPPPATLEDHWMRSRLNACAETANRAIEQHRYHEAADALWHFFWDEFCDWYLEMKKLRFEENSGLTPEWRNLLYIYEMSLRLLHPLMPFLTEELWQRLAKGGGSIARAAYPQYDSGVADAETEKQMAQLQDIVVAARGLRADGKIDKKVQLEGALWGHDAAFTVAQANSDAIRKLANVRLELHQGYAPKLEGAVRSTPEFDLVLRLPEVAGQRGRLLKEVEQLEKLVGNSERQLENEDFLKKAPEKVVQSIRQKKAEYEAQLAKNRAALEAS